HAVIIYGHAGECTLTLGHSGMFFSMATITRTFLVDDLDGSNEEVETVDLSAHNAERLRGKLAKFIENGTRVTGQKPRRALRAVRPAPSGRDQVQAVRDWARKHGLA